MKTDFFDPIKLEEMDQVKFMNRTDKKYWFHAEKLESILESIKDDYFALTIQGDHDLAYSSVYFDTANNFMYTTHHNGKLDRYKLRKRSYISTGISFLEVKFKNNKSRTIKNRVPSNYGTLAFSPAEDDFIQRYTPFSSDELLPVLTNRFTRLTLVNKNFKERCTIDLNLQYVYKNKTWDVENLAIVELKSEGKSFSPLSEALKGNKIKSSGMSKYCIGRVISDPKVKRNLFKAKIRKLEKTIRTNINSHLTTQL